MKNSWVICKREITGFFDSLMAYILLVVFLGLTGFFTWLYGGDVFFVGQASLMSFFSMAYWTLFFFIPAITMKSLADEKKSGTFELLATKPITDFEIVFGKWLGAWSLILISLALSLPYYITVANLGQIDHGATIAAYFGLALVSGVYIGIGVYASSLTNNQIVAFIMSLFVSFFFHLLFDLLASLSSGMVANILHFLSITSHYQTMIRGVIGFENVTFLISLIAVSLVLATVAIRRRAWA
jgi:ABC-2 type transport system permease protein